MASVWTHGEWTVKAGSEEEFVAAWRRFADEVTAELGGEGLVDRPWLLRDRDRPNVFLSFGPWESADAVARFRSTAAFRENLGRLEALLESFAPRTLDEVTRGG